MNRVFLVASGMLQTKKWDNDFSKKHYYLNYGLLSIATKMKSYGYEPLQIHGNFSSPNDIFSKLINLGIEKTKHPIFISITSFFAVQWAQEFCKIINSNLPSIKIVVGGVLENTKP